jgi:hypothetical protein
MALKLSVVLKLSVLVMRAMSVLTVLALGVTGRERR